MVGVRHARTLEKLAEWPTHGIDAHELIWDLHSPGGPTLLVANGGVPTAPETGRSKRDLHRMDSSLVRLDATTGRLMGQWRLQDPRLSLRHLAWGPLMEKRWALPCKPSTTPRRSAARPRCMPGLTGKRCTPLPRCPPQKPVRHRPCKAMAAAS